MWAAVLLLAVVVPDGGTPFGEAAFEAAVGLEGQGHYAEAETELLALARDRSHPDHAFVDDALFEAAVILDERLDQPAEAAALYEEVARRFPSSRLERRSTSRAASLRHGLQSGAGPLKKFDQIVASGRTATQARSEMEALLAATPDFALADRALYWLATSAVEGELWDDARRYLDVLIRRFPASEWAIRGQKMRADVELRQGHWSTARDRYAALAASNDLGLRLVGEEGLRTVRRAVVRLAVFVLAMVWLLAFVVGEWRALRRLPRVPVPIELYYFGVVAGLFAVAAATEHSSIRSATFGIAVGGIVLVGLAGVRSAAEHAAGITPRRWTRVLVLAVSAWCLAWGCVYSSGLTDLVVETMTAGPER